MVSQQQCQKRKKGCKKESIRTSGGERMRAENDVSSSAALMQQVEMAGKEVAAGRYASGDGEVRRKKRQLEVCLCGWCDEHRSERPTEGE